jgi:NAD(P)-dependent dehydrogenase (short-subunit alcohol dehydrogenase family)
MTLFVTGGSRGLGRGIVQAALARGERVAFTYRHDHDAAESLLAWSAAEAPGVRCRAYPLDVRDSSAVDQVAEQVLSDFDTVRAVVSNAGILRNGLAATMSDQDWSAVLETNLTGSFFVARAFLPAFLSRHAGRFVFMGSIAQHGMSGQANYCASKAGLVGLAKALAKEYGRKNITANVVVPGFFDTDMTRKEMNDDRKRFWTTYCPVGRMGGLDEIAAVVLFLASDDASYINGQELPVTGGLDWAA